jgi:hypothetical protein
MVAGVGVLVVGFVRNRGTASAQPAAATTSVESTPVELVATATTAKPAAQQQASAPPRAAGPAHRPATTAQPPLVPILAHGQTTLGAGIVAMRSDSNVTVAFDTDGLRTRRRDKFERLVRTTLPAVYGQRADSMLATMPEGTIAAQGDLLTDLPTRGVRLALRDGWSLALYPETRPGRDGPLVVRYRVAVIQ